MSTTLFSTLYPDVLPYVPGCSELLVDRHILQAAREFCRRTKVWRYNVPTMAAVKNVPDYTLTTPTGSDVLQVIDVRFNGLVLEGKDTDWLDSNMRNWDIESSNSPRYYTLLKRGVITLVYMPSTTTVNAIKARVALIPDTSATGMDADVLEEWGAAIAAGALSTLLRMKDKDWFDRVEADQQMNTFIIGRQNATSKANKSGTMGSRAAKPVSFI